MRDRTIRHHAEAQKQAEAYIRQVAASPADELQKLDAMRQSGALSQEEFDRMKAKLVAG